MEGILPSSPLSPAGPGKEMKMKLTRSHQLLFYTLASSEVQWEKPEWTPRAGSIEHVTLGDFLGFLTSFSCCVKYLSVMRSEKDETLLWHRVGVAHSKHSINKQKLWLTLSYPIPHRSLVKAETKSLPVQPLRCLPQTGFRNECWLNAPVGLTCYLSARGQTSEYHKRLSHTTCKVR